MVEAAHYGGLLLVSLLLAALLAMLLIEAEALSIQERAYALAGGLLVYLGCAFGFSIAWPSSMQGDAILLASPAIAIVAGFAALAVVAPEPTAGAQGELLVLLGASALAVLVGTGIGATAGRSVGARRTRTG